MAEQENKGGMFGDFAKKIGSLVFEEAGAAPAPAKPDVPAPSYAPFALPPASAPTYGSFGSVILPAAVAVDPKFQAMFQKIVEDNNIQGNDYFELRRSLDNMAKLAMPDNAKFPAAFFALGTTVEHVKESAAHYISLIEKNGAEVEVARQASIASKVNVHIEGIAQLQAENEQLEQQVNQIRAQQAANIARVAELDRTAKEAAANIEAKSASYGATKAAYVAAIRADIAAVDQYIVPILQASALPQ